MEESRKLDRTWLCSIVFSDIVNYSSQSVDLQMKWKEYFNGVLAEALRSVPQDDRIVLDTGDGAAICFLGEPEVALLTTLAIRCAFVEQAERDSAAPLIRLGINLGPVKIVRDINGQRNALGDGINVAQRVMSFAAPNQVLVSQSFYEVVSRLSDDFRSLFRYDSVRKDKHVREHVVYELSPSSPENTAAVRHAAVVDEHAPAPPPAPKRGNNMLWIGGGIAAVAVAGAFLAGTALRSPKSEPASAPVVVQQAQPAPAPRAEEPRPVQPTKTTTPAPRQQERAATPAPTKAPEPVAAPAATVDPTGQWQADVKYSWGPTHPEKLDLKIDGNEVLGTASYLRTPRAILDGKLEGNKVTFTTKSQSILGDKTYEEKHMYRGRISGDTIEFMLQTDSGYDSRPPESFTAKRVAAAGH